MHDGVHQESADDYPDAPSESWERQSRRLPGVISIYGESIMAMSINTNVISLNSQRALNSTQSSLGTAMERLSSGLRVNNSKDDAAGLAIASRMESQVRGQNVAIRNANDAISLAQTAEGSIGKITDMLQRMRELAVQSANATNTSADRGNLDKEFQQLSSEITRTITSTRFNGLAVLAGDAGAKSFQVGELNTDRVDLTTTDLSANSSISDVGTADITSETNASSAIATLDEALSTVNVERANYGAYQNRFENIISTLQISSNNTSAARGRIIDADFATETANLSRAQILQQAGTAMVAQANQMPQQVLSLLR
jgi:flagellin